MKTPLLTALLTATLCIAPATAREIHVATTGEDAASGAADAPLRTIQAAANRAMPGDTIIVRDGSPYRLDHDFSGNPRNANQTSPGPFEGLGDGAQSIQVWPRNFISARQLQMGASPIVAKISSKGTEGCHF